MEKVIISGASGFLGGYLTEHLLKQGVTVYGIGTNAERLDRFKNHGNFSPVVATFDDFMKLSDIISDRNFDVFYHFAWEGGFTKAIKDYSIQMKNAAHCGDAVMAAVSLGCKKFVYANTYNQFEIINFLESQEFQPRYTCIYATGKTAGGLISKTLCYNLGLEYSGALVPMPYGKYNYSMQLANVVINNLNKGIPPKLVEGNNTYDLVYVGDIADAFIAIGDKGKNMHEYYVGHRKLKTFREWMIDVRDAIAPGVALKFGEYKDNQQIDYSKIDLDALYRDTGWECKADFKSTIIETAQWVKTQGW
jgi:nucleoside-diphosphate-sugar epimerase